MIEGFVRWLRNEPAVSLNGPALADHLEQQRVLILPQNEAESIDGYGELWKDTVIGDGTVVVAQRDPEGGSYVINALIDVAQAVQGPALYDRLGYVPRHLVLQWNAYDHNGVSALPYGGALGVSGTPETYDAAKGVPILINSRQALDAGTSESLSRVRWAFGQQLFSTLAALQGRRLLGYAPVPYMRNAYTVRTLMERNYGLH